jgi:hypothetical protein
VLAPSTYEDMEWRLVCIKRVGQLAGQGDEPSELVLTDKDGLHYTGFPLAEVTTPSRPVLHLAEFE